MQRSQHLTLSPFAFVSPPHLPSPLLPTSMLQVFHSQALWLDQFAQMLASASPVAPAACSRAPSASWQAFPSIIQSPHKGAKQGRSFFLLHVSLHVLMAATLLMAHYWTIHKYRKTESALLPPTTFLYWPTRWLKLPLSFKKSPSLPVSTYSIWI